jgi:hypothetical protein
MGYGPLRLDRFSPYFDNPQQFGIRNVRATKPYRYLFPFDESILYNIAYFFDCDFDGQDSRDRSFEPIVTEMETWMQNQSQYALEEIRRTPEDIWVRDTRPHRVRDLYRFPALEVSVIDACFEVQHFSDILTRVETTNGQESGPWLRRFLKYLTSHRLMLESDDRYLSLIMPAVDLSRAG